LKQFLDETCKKLNLNWDEKCQLLRNQVVELEASHTATKSIFSQNSYRKWVDGNYETRFNRAIFDIMTLTFSQEESRVAARGKEALIEAAFKDLCMTNADFKTSIESTTKSLGATHTRISVWSRKLNEVLGTTMHVPELRDNRII